MFTWFLSMASFAAQALRDRNEKPNGKELIYYA